MHNHVLITFQLGRLVALGLCVAAVGCRPSKHAPQSTGSQLPQSVQSIDDGGAEFLNDFDEFFEDSVSEPNTEPIEQLTSTRIENFEHQAGDQPELSDEWDFPLSEGDDFFAAPQITSKVHEASELNLRYDPVRLLGFVHSSPGHVETRAILKIGDLMVIMCPGDESDGLELLEIDERIVSLQRGRERWKLALFDQPVVNQAVEPPRPVRDRKVNNSRSTSRPATQVDSLPVIEPSLMREPEPTAPELPDWDPSLMKLPDLPELPDIAELLNPKS